MLLSLIKKFSMWDWFIALALFFSLLVLLEDAESSGKGLLELFHTFLKVGKGFSRQFIYSIFKNPSSASSNGSDNPTSGTQNKTTINADGSRDRGSL
jgi:hypothetical protein